MALQGPPGPTGEAGKSEMNNNENVYITNLSKHIYTQTSSNITYH